MTISVPRSAVPSSVNCLVQPDASTFHSKKSVRVSMQFQPLRRNCRQVKAAASGQMGLGLQLQPIYGKGLAMSSRQIKSAFLICTYASNARCSQSQGQTQTVTRESPTITQAPVHSKEKSPELDDGGTGFPPRDDGDGGGGGGGGGGNWSGGFFLFGFLAFLGFLKDKESEEDYRNSRRR